MPLPWAMALAARSTPTAAAKGVQIAEYLLRALRRTREAAHCGHDAAIPSGESPTAPASCWPPITIAPRHPSASACSDLPWCTSGRRTASIDHWNRDRVRSLLLYLRHPRPGPPRADHRRPVAAPRPGAGGPEPARHPHLPDTRSSNRAAATARRPSSFGRTGSTLAWPDGPHLDVDLHEFESLVERADDADHRGLPASALDCSSRRRSCGGDRASRDVAYEEWAQTTWRDPAGASSAQRSGGRASSGGGRGESGRRMSPSRVGGREWCEPAYRILVASRPRPRRRMRCQRGARRVRHDARGARRRAGTADGDAAPRLTVARPSCGCRRSPELTTRAAAG